MLRNAGGARATTTNAGTGLPGELPGLQTKRSGRAPTLRGAACVNRSAALDSEAPQRSEQPGVADGVRELCPARRLKVRQQVELPAVVGAVMEPA